MKTRRSLPESGHVLGVDIGFSPQRYSGAACRLSWSCGRLAWRFGRFRYNDDERAQVLAETVGEARLLAAAFDGPLRGDLGVIDRYRTRGPASDAAAAAFGRQARSGKYAAGSQA